MSEIINLNDDNFDVNSIVVFNEGNAGIAENVTMRAEKKTSTDNSPDWKVFYKDAKGGEVNEGYYYLNPKHENFQKQLKYQGAALKHIIHAAFGSDIVLPNFASTKDMLDQCMAKINSTPGDATFRIGVSYGTQQRPSPYLRVKNYPVFIEPMSVSSEESKIAFGDAYIMVRPVADKEEDTSDATFSTTSEPVGAQEPAMDMSSFDTPAPAPQDDTAGPDDLPF